MPERLPPQRTVGPESDEPPAPSAAARELLRAFRDHESPSPAAREQGFAALQARLHATAPVAANGGVYALAKAALVTVAVAAAVLLAIKGVSVGVTALADRAQQPAMEAPYQGAAGADGGQAVPRGSREAPPRRPAGVAGDSPASTEPPVAELQPPEPQAAPQPAAVPPLAEQDAPSREPAAASGAARPPRSRASASDYTADDLEAELALIKRAGEAKKAGRHADGLAALREHAERYPRGVLAHERTVLEAELHCAAGRVQEADALVQSFLREHAGSALAGRMRNVCRE